MKPKLTPAQRVEVEGLMMDGVLPDPEHVLYHLVHDRDLALNALHDLLETSAVIDDPEQDKESFVDLQCLRPAYDAAYDVLLTLRPSANDD